MKKNSLGSKLLLAAGAVGTVSGAVGCSERVSPSATLEGKVEPDVKHVAMLNTLKAQTGHAAELALNVYLVLRDKSEFSQQKKEYLNEIFEYETEVASRDGTTVIVPKPDNGEFGKDIYVRRFKASDGEEESVFVRHYFKEEKSKIEKVGQPKNANFNITYKIDPKTGKPIMTQSLKNEMGSLWIPKDAFGVYIVDNEGNVGKENLLVEQDILTGEEGSLVLRTKSLGDKANGTYRVKVVGKYHKVKPQIKPAESLDDVTDWSQVKLFMDIGMAMGSLEHIYSGSNPMNGAAAPVCTGSSCSVPDEPASAKKRVSLLLSNYHVFDNTLEVGVVRKILKRVPGKKEPVVAGMYMTLATLPMAKFDEREDGTWLPLNVYGNFYKQDLDAVIMELENAWTKGSVPEVKWAKCNPKMGDRAVVIGHPLGLIDEQVNDNARISNPDHNAGSDWLDMIAFYGNLIGGNSGGGLYNMDGEFLGINSGSYVKVSMKGEKHSEGVDLSKLDEMKKFLERDDKDKPLFAPERRDAFVKAVFSALAKTEEGKTARESMKAETAKELMAVYTSEFGKPTGRVAVIPTGLDLARKGTRIQEWMHEKGLDIGQPRKFSFSGNNDALNGCKK